MKIIYEKKFQLYVCLVVCFWFLFMFAKSHMSTCENIMNCCLIGKKSMFTYFSGPVLKGTLTFKEKLLMCIRFCLSAQFLEWLTSFCTFKFRYHSEIKVSTPDTSLKCLPVQKPYKILTLRVLDIVNQPSLLTPDFFWLSSAKCQVLSSTMMCMSGPMFFCFFFSFCFPN